MTTMTLNQYLRDVRHPTYISKFKHENHLKCFFFTLQMQSAWESRSGTEVSVSDKLQIFLVLVKIISSI